jgi:small subunit ribosomal protein S20
MPNKHAALKDLRKNRKRAAHNARLKTHMRSLLRQAQLLIKEGKLKEAKLASIKFQQIVDKAAKNEIVSKNAASRKKSSLMKALNQTK